MLQPRLLAPLRALGRAIGPAAISRQPLTRQPLLRTLSGPSILPKPPSSFPRTTTLSPLSQVRYASHAAQGASNKHSRDPAGKRLGAKRTGGEYVVPGCIIFRQRGTKWFPGENCGVGRDHTIFAKHAGYVRYYRDPQLHPDRKYIGVVFEKDEKLPHPRHLPTRRRLNMVAVPARPASVAGQSDLMATIDETHGTRITSVQAVNAAEGPQLRPGYMYREANWQIGRAAEKAGIEAVPYDRSNRWLAWRKRKARADRAAQMKSLKGKKKAGKKAK